MKRNFETNLLLAVPELAYGSFNQLTKNPIVLSNAIGCEEHVNIVALDCKKAEDIPSCLERLIKQLDESITDTTDEKTIVKIQNSQEYLQDLLNEIETGGYQHDVPQALKEIVSQQLWNYRIKEKQMLYLSDLGYLED